jgi:hypothetical protein
MRISKRTKKTMIVQRSRARLLGGIISIYQFTKILVKGVNKPRKNTQPKIPKRYKSLRI